MPYEIKDPATPTVSLAELRSCRHAAERITRTVSYLEKYPPQACLWQLPSQRLSRSWASFVLELQLR